MFCVSSGRLLGFVVSKDGIRLDPCKVQAINDSFMIASGIPTQVGQQLGDRHGSEIATMALDLLGASAMFSIPHRPKVKECYLLECMYSSHLFCDRNAFCFVLESILVQ